MLEASGKNSNFSAETFAEAPETYQTSWSLIIPTHNQTASKEDDSSSQQLHMVSQGLIVLAPGFKWPKYEFAL